MGETENLLTLHADKVEWTEPVDLGQMEDLLTLDADKVERTGTVDLGETEDLLILHARYCRFFFVSSSLPSTSVVWTMR